MKVFLKLLKHLVEFLTTLLNETNHDEPVLRMKFEVSAVNLSNIRDSELQIELVQLTFKPEFHAENFLIPHFDLEARGSQELFAFKESQDDSEEELNDLFFHS